MTNIYCLKEPVTETVFYVGQTKLHIEARLYQHVAESVSGSSKKCARIRDIISEGHQPTIHLLEQCSPEEATKRERHWILHYSSAEQDMTNGPPVDDIKAIRRNFTLSGDTMVMLAELAEENAGGNLSLMLRKMVERTYGEPEKLNFYPPKAEVLPSMQAPSAN